MPEQDWRARPPYQPPRKDFDSKIRGSCHCGAVVYWLSRDQPLASKYCHCRDCQVIHGAPFQWAAIVQKSDMAFEQGTEHLQFYSSSSGATTHEMPCKVRCAQCGTLIMDEGRNMALLFPTLLSLTQQQREGFAAECHIFYSQRVLDVNDGKTKWTGIDGKSEKYVQK